MDELEKIKKEKMEKMIRKSTELIIDVNDENFKEKVIKQSENIPVLVDFWAQWCMPCKMLAPTLEKLANEYSGKFILAKLNVDLAKKTSQEYKIMGIPNVKLFKSGKPVAEFVGVVEESTVKRMLDDNI